jgi:hypothetical protein
VNQQGAQIAVTVLSDPEQHGLAARGMLARNQPQIGAQLASILKRCALPTAATSAVAVSGLSTPEQKYINRPE